VKETVSGGFGLVGLWTHAPHPNADKVFVNWIASKEGSTLFGRADGSASIRAAVDSTAWLPASLIPKPNGEYLDAYE
jgi:ABC-type glycerol-3-phosphate transport system substrate-binding protein